MTTISTTTAREIQIEGGAASAPGKPDAPLWSVKIDLAYAGGGARNVVRKTQALRVLAEDGEPRKVGTAQFRDPRLMAAAAAPSGHQAGYRVRIGPEQATGADNWYWLRPYSSGRLVDLLLANSASASNWPDLQASEMRLPETQLLAGRIPVSVLLEADTWLGHVQRAKIDYLFANKSAGLRVFTTPGSSPRLPAYLTPLGLEFFALVPDPEEAFSAAARDPIWALVRLSWTYDRTGKLLPSIALLGPLKQPPGATDVDGFPSVAVAGARQAAIEAAMAQAFATTQETDLRLDLDRRGDMPTLIFPLDTTKPARPLFTHAPRAWQIVLRAAEMRATITSIVDGFPKASAINLRQARLAVAKGASRLDLSSSDDFAVPTDTLDLAATPGAKGWLATRNWKKGDAGLQLGDLRALLARQYADAQLIANSGVPIEAFCPIKQGWLQIRLPMSPPDRPTVAVQAAKPPAIGDLARLPLCESDQTSTSERAIELASADEAHTTVEFANGKCQRVTLRLAQARGRLRGLLFVSQASPRDGEILPRLRNGSTTDWPISFGPGAGAADRDVRPVEIGLSEAGATLTFADIAPEDILVWSADPALPWISTYNLSQTALPRLPSVGRSLVARVAAARLAIDLSSGQYPSVADDGLAVWPAWANASGFHGQTLPTLAGIERTVTAPYRFTLRHDLPILDALFATAMPTVPDLTLLGSDEPAKAPGRYSTAVDRDLLKDSWARLTRDHQLTETRYAQALTFTNGDNQDGLDVGNFVLPFKWPSKHAAFVAQTGAGLPLGEFSLGKTGTGEPIRYAGDRALSGFGPSALAIGGHSVDIVGNAAASWQGEGDYLFDSASVAFGDADGTEIRRLRRLDAVDQAPREIKLLTLDSVLDLGGGVRFWVRDLPVVKQDWQGKSALWFDGATSSFDRPGGGRDIYSREAVPQSLYEWRVWMDPATRLDELVEGDIAVDFGIVAKPLRLARFVKAPDGSCEIVLTVALHVPGLDAPQGAQVNGEARPATSIGTLKLTRDAAGTTQRALVEGRIALRVPVVLEGDRQKRTCLIDLTIVSSKIVAARLTAVLYGKLLEFSCDNEATLTDGRFALAFVPATASKPVAIDSAVLRWGDERLASLTLVAALALTDDLQINFKTRALTWLGATLVEPRLALDHDAGVVWLDFEDNAAEAWMPIAGMPFARISARGMLWLDGEMVRGFVNVVASGANDGTGLKSRLRYNWWSDGAPTLELDLHCEGESLIAWPTKTEAIDPETPGSEAQKALTVRIDPAAPRLRHKVTAMVQGYPIRADALVKTQVDPETPPRYALKDPLRLVMRAEHRLIAEDRTPVGWVSLDDVVLFDVAGLAQHDGKELAFAARYRNGSYRGQTQPAAVPAPGAVRRAIAATGFASPELISELQKQQGLVLLGGSQLLIAMNDAHRSLGLPWLMPYPIQAAEWPKFTQQGAGRSWQVAWYDRKAPRVVPAAASAAIAIGQAYYSRLIGQLAGGDGAERSIAFVEQSFVDLADWSTAPPAPATIPLFMRSIIALADLWAELGPNETELQNRLLQPVVLENKTSRLVRVAPGHTTEPSMSGPTAIELVVLRRSGAVKTLTLERGDSAESGVGALPTMVLRDLVTRKFPDWIAAWQVKVAYRRDDHSGKASAEVSLVDQLHGPVEIEPVIHNDGPALPTLPLRPAGKSFFAAPSRGWSAEPAYGGAKPVVLHRDHSRPFQAHGAGIAGRINAFRATAGGGGGKSSPYLASARQILFAAGGTAETSGAWPRHQALVTPRPVGPGDGAPTIVPTRMVIGSVGLRPGVFIAETTALLMPPPMTAQRSEVRFTFQPAVVQQHRTPRATRLPDTNNLVWRRRTFVIGDGTPLAEDATTTWLPWRVYSRPVAGYRTYKSGDSVEIPDPDQLILLRLNEASQSIAETAKRIAFDFDLPNSADIATLRKATFRLLVDSMEFALVPVPTTVDRPFAVQVSDPTVLQGALAALNGANADTRIRIEAALDLAVDVTADAPAGFARAPNVRLQLPIAFVRSGRPSVVVREQTLVFGDPAFDRMLGTATASVAIRQSAQKLLQFALDRDTYDLESPIQFAVGMVENGIFQPDATPYGLAMKRIREHAAAVDVFLRDAKGNAVETSALPQAQALAIDPLRLRTADGAPLRPGDLLRMSASVGGAKLDLEVKIAAEPVVPPAPAVYHLIIADHAFSKAITALSASGPAPQLIETPTLTEDLARGFVRRRGLFFWSFPLPPGFDEQACASLIKVDRAGGGQLPNLTSDFLPLE